MLSSKSIIEDFVKSPTEENMKALCDRALKEKLSDNEIAILTEGLARSGKVLSFPKELKLADIASTGGPSSLSTLLCPLILSNLGFSVPKLGVVGRPAGAIDVLWQIPGFKIDFLASDVLACILKYKYCHFIADQNYAPLDAQLFAYRSRKIFKAIPALVIASILSKKMAVGLKYIGLDVRVSKIGNFGITWDIAQSNCYKFVSIANKLGFHSRCFLNDFNTIQQPFIGRGEALIALNEIFEDRAKTLLKDHLHNCIQMSISLGNEIGKSIPPSISSIKTAFEENVKAQGSSMNNFNKKIESLQKGHNREIRAVKNGYLYIDIESVRNILVWGQSQNTFDRFPDNCGIIFQKVSNEFIEKDQVVLTYRIDKIDEVQFENQLKNCFSIFPSKIENLLKSEVIQ